MSDLNGRIVSWAGYGEHIPLRCKKCQASFYTKNIDFIGSRSVFDAWFYTAEEKGLSNKCNTDDHTIADLEPAEDWMHLESRICPNEDTPET